MSTRILFLSLIGLGALHIILIFVDSRYSHPRNSDVRLKYAMDGTTEENLEVEQTYTIMGPAIDVINYSTSALSLQEVTEPTSQLSPIQQPSSENLEVAQTYTRMGPAIDVINDSSSALPLQEVTEPTSQLSPIQQPSSENLEVPQTYTRMGLAIDVINYSTSALPLQEVTEPTSQLSPIRQPSLNSKAVNEVDVPLEETQLQHSVSRVLRDEIRYAMRDYRYPNGKYNISARKLDDLVMEKNGRPIRSMILSSWRMGSTFFGDIINAYPANFYHFEPLLGFPETPIRRPPFAAKALERVKALFNCEYEDLDTYFEYVKDNPWMFDHNTHLSNHCKVHKDLCYNHRFLSAMCKLFPFQSMKLVRLGLNVAQELLADERLALRMVLLVRDPRGTLQSRKAHDWCMRNPHCADPDFVCADLVSDYKLAVELLKKYPTTFKVIRYEDLATEPYKVTKEVSAFYGLNFHKDMEVFLNTHTKKNRGDLFTTFRDSKAACFHWRTELKYEEVEEIQQSCAAAMKYWGYVPAMNATHQREFNPVTKYSLN